MRVFAILAEALGKGAYETTRFGAKSVKTGTNNATRWALG